MNIREIIYTQSRKVVKDQNKSLLDFTDATPLLESGLDSLGIALLVANVEDETGLDPFGSGDDIEIPTTIGDFIRIYQNAAAAR